MAYRSNLKSPSPTSTDSPLKRSPVTNNGLGHSDVSQYLGTALTPGQESTSPLNDQLVQVSLTDLETSDLVIDSAWHFDTPATSSRISTPLGGREDGGDRKAAPSSSTSGPMIVFVETQGTDATKRRRESNRASQRAFRDRKEKHRQYLEHQLAALQAQYKDLLELSTIQAGNIHRFGAQIMALTAELNSAHFSNMQTMNETAYFDVTTQNFNLNVSAPQEYPSYEEMEIGGSIMKFPQL